MTTPHTRYLVIDRSGIVHPAPTFVLSALDLRTRDALCGYAHRLPSEQVRQILEVANDLDAWRNAHIARHRNFDPFVAPDFEDPWIKKAIESPGAKVALYLIDKSTTWRYGNGQP